LARDPDLSEKLMKEHFLQGQLAAKWLCFSELVSVSLQKLVLPMKKAAFSGFFFLADWLS
jgi:hypothetical protein